MAYLFLSDTIRQIEDDFYKSSKSNDALMQLASFCIYNQVLKLSQTTSKILVLTGSGNNGGDGYFAATLLNNQDLNVKVCEILPAKSQLCKLKKQEYKGEILPFSAELVNEADIVVDAILGTGFKGEVDKYLCDIFSAVNNSGATVIAVDLPSGLCADTADINSCCIKADITVTFIGYKKCLLRFPSAEKCGKVILNELGLKNLENYKNEGVVTKSVKIPKRLKNTHKGTYGTAALICGSYGMAGAAILAAKACLRSGVGIAKLILDNSIYPIVASSVSEAVFITDINDTRLVLKNIEKADSVLIGCGLSQSKQAEKLLYLAVENARKTLIIDADGLNLTAKRIDLIEGLKAELILTPHPGEMSRLMSVSVEEIEANREHYATLLAKKLSATVVLKGAITVIADKVGNLYYNDLGNAGMATGGSGDTLAGIIAALSAGGMSAVSAAVTGVYIHSLAGDIAKEKYGEISLLPSDIINALPEAFKLSGE